MNRRNFLSGITLSAAGLSFYPYSANSLFAGRDGEMFFDISLAEWSLRKKLFSGQLKNLDFPEYTRKNFGIEAVEYVNQFFPSAKSNYIQELRQRCFDAGVKSLLIMIDKEGDLGEQYYPKRMRAVERHFPWVEAAKLLGCHSIRVNARGNGTEKEVADAVTESLRKLSEFANDYDINVLVENHGGYSSNGKWLASLMENVGMENCGTLPDFGNFRISNKEEYDKYKGMKELMPYAKGVSAKSNRFDEEGNEVSTDFEKVLKIIKESGYRDYIGIEYSGQQLDEDKGIIATRDLLIRYGEKLSG